MIWNGRTDRSRPVGRDTTYSILVIDTRSEQTDLVELCAIYVLDTKIITWNGWTDRSRRVVLDTTYSILRTRYLCAILVVLDNKTKPRTNPSKLLRSAARALIRNRTHVGLGILLGHRLDSDLRLGLRRALICDSRDGSSFLERLPTYPTCRYLS